MADDSKDNLIEAAVTYARLGWRTIPVLGKVPQGGAGWPNLATCDGGEIAAMLLDCHCDGVGVLLGPRSGLIDVECDSPAAETELQDLFAGAIPATPTFRSARGLHRLFRWSDAMPASEIGKAKFLLGSIEFRLGGGDKAAQTVFPPSGGREWVIDPVACPPAEIPASVLVRIATRVAESRQPRRATIPAPKFEHGDEQLDVGRWLARRGQETRGFEIAGGVRRWLITCPRVEAHTTADGVRDCCVTQEVVSGRLGGHCFHASCGMVDWAALSEAIGRPEYQDYHPDAPALDEGPALSLLAGSAKLAESSDDDEADEDGDDFGELTDLSFPAECLDVPGLVGEIIAHTLATSLYPQPELALAGALSLLGTITGRKVTDCLGTRTNVYVLGLGLSGVGKEQARRVNKDLLIRALAEKLIGSERVGSHAGIVTTVHDTPACLMQLDEMGRLLETMKDPKKAPHLYNCITVLMQLYSSSGTIWKADAYADAKKVKTVDQPHLCIYGTATPDSFWHSLSTENIAEGLIGRLLVFEGRGYSVQMQRPASDDPPKDLVEAVRWWNELRTGGNLAGEHPAPRKIPHTPEAFERFQGHILGINERRITEHPLRAAVWSRSGEKVAKLALLHACSRSRCVPETITLRDVEWGVRLGNWLTRRLLAGCAQHVSENETEAKAKRVLGMIPVSGVQLATLCRRTQWLKPRERDDIIRDLQAAGLVEISIERTRTKPRTVLKRRERLRKAGA